MRETTKSAIMHSSQEMQLVLAGIGLLIVIFSIILYIRYLRPNTGKAVLSWIAATVMGTAILLYRQATPQSWPESFHNENERLLWVLGGFLLGFFLIPLLVKLYLKKWIRDENTAEEKAVGWAGIRAWVRGGNLVCCLGISLSASLGFGYSFWVMLVLTVGALAAYPVYKSFSQPTTAVPDAVAKNLQPATSPDDLSAEREKVLTLLENGRITAAECAELLNALRETTNSATPPRESQPMNHTQKVILIGGGLLLFAFFLPWFSINLGQELERASNQLQGAIPGGANFPDISSHFNLKTDSIKLSGGDISHGLGWLILLLGLGVVALPYVAEQINRQTRWKITAGALAIGTIILIYLLTGNLHNASIGILLVIAGYALIFTVSMKQRVLP